MPIKRTANKQQKHNNDLSVEELTRATVRLAESYVAQGLMTEREALKYLNISRLVFEQYRSSPPPDGDAPQRPQ